MNCPVARGGGGFEWDGHPNFGCILAVASGREVVGSAVYGLLLELGVPEYYSSIRMMDAGRGDESDVEAVAELAGLLGVPLTVEAER